MVDMILVIDKPRVVILIININLNELQLPFGTVLKYS